MKKTISIISIIMLIIMFSTSVFAAVITTTELKLELAEDNICTINLADSGKLEKKLVSISDPKKEVTLQITVENTKKDETVILPSEIFLVIDNSLSMEQEIDVDVTREEAVVAAAKSLAQKLLTVQPTTKIGVVSFSTLDSSKGETEGTINDAKLQLPLSSNITDILAAIDGIKYTGPRTNIEAGLTVAQNNFTSEENNKALILLTDGVPNTAVGGPTFTYSGDVATKTADKLKEIDNAKIKVISVMTGVSAEASPFDETTLPAGEELKTYKDLAEEIFGTEKFPYVGNFYFITDDQINSTITKSVYSNIAVTKESYLKNIKVMDYFPADIINNYDYELVEQANIGKVDTTVDTTNNSITWNIETLKYGEVAKMVYKLKLKSNYDKNIINVVMPTNKKVDVNFTDTDDTDKNATSDVSPKIVLRQYIYKDEQPDKIPQTGSNIETITIISGTILTISIIASIVSIKKYRF